MPGLRTVVYKVPDLEKAKDWYSKAFDQKPYFDEVFYVGFNIGGYELGLLPYEGEEVIHGNASTAYWSVENVDQKIGHLISIGAHLEDEPMDVGEGVIVASVKDPWNNIIGIIYNPYFKIT
jgi:predicted enzyme related to lactoylglutathione lyase